MNDPTKLSGAKSLLASRTFWGVVLAAIAGLTPLVVQAVKNNKLSPENAGAMVLVVVGAIQAVVGRVSATERLYTPEGIPGPDKTDLVEGDR